MRWSCPHCGVNLAISDEKLGGGWSFSRCYKCGGFALVRRSEVNLIKVDKAPAGETVLLPEASETPMLSGQATQKLDQYMAKAEAKNNQALANQVAVQAAAQVVQQIVAAQNETAATSNTNNDVVGLPTPLPEMPSRGISRNRMLPLAIGLAGTFAVASGIYLYIQGQILWDKARTTAVQDVRVTAPTIKQATAGATEVIQAPKLTVAQAEIISDEVRESAMAPNRTTAVHENLGAVGSMLVKAKNTNARLHSGPGLQYPVTGLIDPQMNYSVVEWNDEWFKIVPKKSLNGRESEAAWVRNDMVQSVSSASNN